MGIFQFIQANARYGRILILDRLISRFIPVARGRNKNAQGKFCLFTRGVYKILAGRAQKRVDIGLSDIFIRRVAFTLNRPIIARNRLCHQIDARVFGADVIFKGKFIPRPDLGNMRGITRVCPEPGGDEFFKARALFSLG